MDPEPVKAENLQKVRLTNDRTQAPGVTPDRIKVGGHFFVLCPEGEKSGKGLAPGNGMMYNQFVKIRASARILEEISHV